MKRRFVVGEVEFLLDGDRLSFWPTNTARTLQTVAAAGIAIVSATCAFIVAKDQPLAGLIGEGNAWNTAAVIALAIFSLGLLVAIPPYLWGTSSALVLDAKNRSLLVCGEPRIDLRSATEVIVTNLPGNPEVVDSWSVALRDDRKTYFMPLLFFSQKGDADRVSAEVGKLFGLPVSP